MADVGDDLERLLMEVRKTISDNRQFLEKLGDETVEDETVGDDSAEDEPDGAGAKDDYEEL